MIDKEIIRNQSGYYDETAGKAILNIEREKKMNTKQEKYGKHRQQMERSIAW